MVKDIIDKIKENGQIKVVSFDIFDTLLFRTVTIPPYVFVRMYEKRPDLFPEYTNKDDWKNARMMAERIARQNKKFYVKADFIEISLKEIYETLPTAYAKNADELMKLEIECEKETCFVNDEMYETIKYIKNVLNLKVILTSDMYLGGKIIGEILEYNGVDLSLFEQIFISVDYDTSKRDGALYDLVAKTMGIKNEEMFHVGDNIYSDIGIANKHNIPNFYYNFISEGNARFPFFTMEEMAYDLIAQPICPIRLLGASKNPYTDKRDKEFFDIGAMIVGPFFTMFSEGVIDNAIKNNISVIRPLMREGMFLTKMIRNAAEARGLNYSVEPLYISRYAMQTSALEYIEPPTIKNMLITTGLTIKSILKTLNIEEEVGDKLKDIISYKVEEIRTLNINGKKVFDEVEEFLTSKEIIDLIRTKNKGDSKIIKDYFKDAGITSKAILVDIGWKATIPTSLAKMFKDLDLITLMCFAHPDVAINTIGGGDVRGFIGNYGADKKLIGDVYVYLMEMFLLAEEGTTVGYKYEDGKVVPKTLKIEYPQWQIDGIKKLQEGILSFQNEFLKLANKKPHLRNWKNNNIEVCNILNRLFCFPELNEVKRLKDVQFDQNYGSNMLMPLISDEAIDKVKDVDINEFYSRARTTRPEWYSGLNVLKNPTFYYEIKAQNIHRYAYYSVVMLVKRMLREVGDNKFILVTAGANTKMVLSLLKSMEKLDMVYGIVDNDENLHGVRMYGIEVNAVEHDYELNTYFCPISSRTASDSLYKQIVEAKGSNIKYISFFNK